MKVDMSRQIVDPTSGEALSGATLGGSLALALMNTNAADGDFARKISVLAQQFQQGGEQEIPVKEIGRILEAVDAASIRAWLKGHIAYLLGDDMPDEETKTFFNGLYNSDNEEK